MTTNINFKFRIVAIVTIVIAIIIAFSIWNHPESSASEQSTDDAYVQAHFTMIVPQVSGVITEVSVSDHQRVEAGDTLIRIDDRELSIAVNAAKAMVDTLKAKLIQQQSIIAQAQAVVLSSSANLKLAEVNRHRYSNLALDGSGTMQGKQQAEAEWQTKLASYEQAKAGLDVAKQQVAILEAELEKAQSTKDDAELKLSYTHIKAPISGIVDQRRARMGGYARVGDSLVTLVPLDAMYIEANFRETQLACVQVGQEVDITVDAFPGIHFKGHVDSLAPASGVSYSSVPPHNATGNFTKITQRLPVRIQLDTEEKNRDRLKVGMSVRPTIKVNDCSSK